MARLPLHVSRDDLAGAGVVALVQAARAYNAASGVPFGQYARLRIRGAMVDELRANDWASRGVRRRNRRLTDHSDRLSAELGRPATDSELAEALSSTPAQIAKIRDDADRASVLSLHAGTQHIDLMTQTLAAGGPTPEERVVHAERIGTLLSAVSVLPERLRVVVTGYDLMERPMAELASELGVSESRVSQMRAEALGLLREAVTAAEEIPEQRSASDAPAGLAQRRRRAYVDAARTATDLRGRIDAGVAALDAGSGPEQVIRR